MWLVCLVLMLVWHRFSALARLSMVALTVQFPPPSASPSAHTDNTDGNDDTASVQSWADRCGKCPIQAETRFRRSLGTDESSYTNKAGASVVILKNSFI